MNYSKEFNRQLIAYVEEVLIDNKEFLTLEQITQKSIFLSNISTQKLARVLKELIDFGWVEKNCNKNGKMVYKMREFNI